MPADGFVLRMSDGAEIVVRRRGPRGATRLYLSHGNGFAIDGYEAFWGPLAARFELVLFDVRNHGRNPFHGAAGHTWTRIAEDFPEIVHAVEAALGKATLTAGVFHSLSAVAASIASLKHGRLWDRLVLVDPPLPAPPGHRLHGEIVANNAKMARWALRRRDRFDDPAELAAGFAATRSLQRWVPGAHEAMARAVLRRAADHYVLACPRELEARIYGGNDDGRLWPALARLPRPVLIIAADTGLPDTDGPARLSKGAAEEFGFDYAEVPETTHLLQVERPAECRAVVERFLA